MKKIIFFTSLLIYLSNYAQHNYDNQNIIYSHSNSKITIGSNQIFGNYSNSASILEISSPNSDSAYFGAKTNNGVIQIGLHDQYSNGIYFSNNKPFVNYMTGGVGEIMRFQTDGNVSIGTTESATGYKLSVGGKIMAEEVRVMLEGFWPDYVFEVKYNLTSLNELEKFIKKNKHLPNIPSAKNVKENGINVGDMNAKLLEKIEELTLYVINLHKDNEKLKEELQILKTTNNLK